MLLRNTLITHRREVKDRLARRLPKSVSAAMRSPTQPATRADAITTQYLRAFIEELTQDCRWLGSIGSVRMRMLVKAKIALVISAPYRAAVRPKSAPPSSWAAIVSGFTTTLCAAALTSRVKAIVAC